MSVRYLYPKSSPGTFSRVCLIICFTLPNFSAVSLIFSIFNFKYSSKYSHPAGKQTEPHFLAGGISKYSCLETNCKSHLYLQTHTKLQNNLRRYLWRFLVQPLLSKPDQLDDAVQSPKKLSSEYNQEVRIPDLIDNLSQCLTTLIMEKIAPNI